MSSYSRPIVIYRTINQAETGQRPFFASPNSVSGEAVGFKWRFICAANDEGHKSDSLICVAIDYYKGTKDSAHAALAYYNAGLVAMDNEDSEASLHNFLKTIDWLGESDNDELQFMVRYKMSRLFNLRLITDEELRLGKAALPYA